jgi:transcriptional regulator with XRE-family HTH domain
MGNKRWPQQRVFAERVKEFCIRNNLLTSRGAIKMDVVSDMFNLHEDTLRQFLQNTTRNRPHINTLTFIASVLGCSVAEFLDAPTDPPPALSHERWAGLNERERGLLTSLLAEVASDDLSADEKEELCRVVLEAKERMSRQKAIWISSCKVN